MPNQYVNKVVFGDQTLLDLTTDTVTPSVLMEGYTAHDKSGALIIGTATQGGSVTQDQDGFIVLPPDGSGGGGDAWSWMGKNPTKVKTLINEKIYLEDTAYATWTPSTTQTTLINSQTLTAENIDVGLYDVITVYRYHAHFEYGDGGTTGGKTLEFSFGNSYVYCGRPSNTASWTSGIYSTYSSASLSALFNTLYVNSSGVESFSNSVNYGVYVTGGINPTISISNNILTYTPSTPVIYARCNNTYFSEVNASVVEQSTSYFEQTAEVWRVDKWTSPLGAQINEVLEKLQR